MSSDVEYIVSFFDKSWKCFDICRLPGTLISYNARYSAICGVGNHDDGRVTSVDKNLVFCNLKLHGLNERFILTQETQHSRIVILEES